MFLALWDRARYYPERVFGVRFWPKEQEHQRGVVVSYPKWGAASRTEWNWTGIIHNAAEKRLGQTWYLTPPALPDEEWPVGLDDMVGYFAFFRVQQEWVNQW